MQDMEQDIDRMQKRLYNLNPDMARVYSSLERKGAVTSSIPSPADNLAISQEGKKLRIMEKVRSR